jgi:spore germination protein YaaH
LPAVNIDIEISVQNTSDVKALTALSQKAAEGMHAVNPHSHVTYDTPAEGELANGCGKQYDRDYDYKDMAAALDFLVVMDYDSNDHPKDGKTHAESCDSCFFANDALPVVQKGVECYAQLGVPADKLVLAFPWCECSPSAWLLLLSGQELISCTVSVFSTDGYDYTCAGQPNTPSKGACNVTAATQIGLPAAAEKLAVSSVGGGRQWDDVSKTPWFYCEHQVQTVSFCGLSHSG